MNKHTAARPYRLYLFTLLSAQAVLLAIISWNTGPGWNEWAHLPSGLFSIQYGSYVPYSVNPPLARIYSRYEILIS